MNTVIFDLGGTLSNYAEGIVRSINYALPKLGFMELPKEDLLQYIGPCLHLIFERLTGMTDEDFILRAITIFPHGLTISTSLSNVIIEQT